MNNSEWHSHSLPSLLREALIQKSDWIIGIQSQWFTGVCFSSNCWNAWFKFLLPQKFLVSDKRTSCKQWRKKTFSERFGQKTGKERERSFGCKDGDVKCASRITNWWAHISLLIRPHNELFILLTKDSLLKCLKPLLDLRLFAGFLPSSRLICHCGLWSNAKWGIQRKCCSFQEHPAFPVCNVETCKRFGAENILARTSLAQKRRQAFPVKFIENKESIWGKVGKPATNWSGQNWTRQFATSDWDFKFGILDFQTQGFCNCTKFKDFAIAPNPF